MTSVADLRAAMHDERLAHPDGSPRFWELHGVLFDALAEADDATGEAQDPP